MDGKADCEAPPMIGCSVNVVRGKIAWVCSPVWWPRTFSSSGSKGFLCTGLTQIYRKSIATAAANIAIVTIATSTRPTAEEG